MQTLIDLSCKQNQGVVFFMKHSVLKEPSQTPSPLRILNGNPDQYPQNMVGSDPSNPQNNLFQFIANDNFCFVTLLFYLT